MTVTSTSTRDSEWKLAGQITTWVGAPILFVALFLPFAFAGSLWSLGTGEAILLTLLLLAAAGVSIVFVFVDRPVLVAAQLGLSIYAFGELLGSGGNLGGLGIGYWLALIGALTMVTGASLLVAAIWDRPGGWGSRRPVTPQDVARDAVEPRERLGG